jgi:NADP-dependent 3-hydroxy acid dehydrogenase YdfG
MRRMDQVIVITGASSGIGAALAEVVVSRAARVVLAARREPELAALAARLGERALAVPTDVTRRADNERLRDRALERFGQIDVWVANAGRGISRPVSELTDDDVDEMMRVNVKSALYGMQEVLPHFKERGTGHVINISSMLGRIPYAITRTAYTATKHFLNALTSGIRSEVQETHPGIQFSLVSPGVVRTNFGLHSRHGGPDSWQHTDAESAEVVAAVIAGVMESRRPDVYTRPGSRSRVVAYYDALGADA